MKTFTVRLQFPRPFNLQPPIAGRELPVLTSEGPRKARVIRTIPDGTGFGWDVVLEYDPGSTPEENPA
jgi:hypothetical protein